MNKVIKISDLSGLCTLTYKGGNSPLCVGEPATFMPFKGFFGESLKGIGIPVSDSKMDGIAWRKRDTSNQQFTQSVVTLVKNVTPDTFLTRLTPDVIQFITGKKSTKAVKGFNLPILTQEETIICTLAEFALDKFHTLNGIELKCSFYEGGEISWKSKH